MNAKHVAENAKQIIARAREIGAEQGRVYDETGEYPKDAISFEFNGQMIINPFRSPCRRFEVKNPVEYYGRPFIESGFVLGLR